MNRQHLAARQSGAALVIGLVLLVVLTLLAVSSMNSASLEFIMAGNEQYRANAFQMAETGIEQTILQGTFSTADPDGTAYASPVGAGDAWSSVVNQPLKGAAQDPPANYDQSTFATYHFEILSTGTSTRGATALNTQGIMIVSSKSSDQNADPAGGTTKFN